MRFDNNRFESDAKKCRSETIMYEYLSTVFELGIWTPRAGIFMDIYNFEI
jgi:hypothetical protein